MIIKSYHICMKKFWKYFSIVMLSLIGLCAIGILYLFIVPNSSLFGICYISYNKNFSSNIYSLSDNAINKITLNSYNYDINVVSAQDSNIYAKVYANSFGFVLKKNSQVKIAANLVSGNLTITVTEPSGACVANNSKITLYIPQNNAIDISFNNHNALTNIDDDKLAFDNFAYITNNGEATIKACSIDGKLTVKLNRGNFTLNQGVSLNNNDVEFNSNTGNFYATSATLGNFTVLKNNRAMIKLNNCDNFNLSTTSAGGSVNINQVNEIAVTSSDTNLTVGKILTGASITLTQSGKVNVGEINSQATIKTRDGNIVVDKATAALYLSSTHNGNIILKDTTSSLLAESAYGDISVYFNAAAESYSTNQNSRKLQATTFDGQIIASGVENVSVDITGNGNASIYMNNVIGQNYVKAGNGNAYVEFADESAFNLKTKAVTGKLNINFSTLESLGYNNHEFTGEQNFMINTGSANGNVLNAEVKSGFIKIRDVATKNF